MRTIKDITGDEPVEIFLQKGFFDKIYWIEKVFGDKLALGGGKLKSFHCKWVSLVENNRFVCIVAHRGSSKTSLLGIWFPLWICWYSRNKNILIVSRTLEQSTKIMDLIRETIEENELLKNLIPDNKSVTWKKTELNTTTKCKIYCKALTKNIRGDRTDYILCDEAGTYTDHDLFGSVVEPTVDLRKGRIIAIGTPETQVDLLSQLSRNKQYTTSWYPVIGKDGKSNWPEIYDDEELERIKLRIGESAFEREYLVNPNAEVEGALYPAELIAKSTDYDLEFNSIPNDKGTRYLAGDFAIASGPKADFDAYMVVEKVGGKTIIKHGERHKGMSINGKIDRMRELFELHDCESIILDPSHVGHAVKNGLRDYGLPVYEAEMHSAARSKLLINLRRMLDSGEIVIPFNQSHSQTNTFVNNLIGELIGFKETKSLATRSIIYKSTAVHDDCAMALAMACLKSGLKREFLDIIGI